MILFKKYQSGGSFNAPRAGFVVKSRELEGPNLFKIKLQHSQMNGADDNYGSGRRGSRGHGAGASTAPNLKLPEFKGLTNESRYMGEKALELMRKIQNEMMMNPDGFEQSSTYQSYVLELEELKTRKPELENNRKIFTEYAKNANTAPQINHGGYGVYRDKQKNIVYLPIEQGDLYSELTPISGRELVELRDSSTGNVVIDGKSTPIMFNNEILESAIYNYTQKQIDETTKQAFAGIKSQQSTIDSTKLEYVTATGTYTEEQMAEFLSESAKAQSNKAGLAAAFADYVSTVYSDPKLYSTLYLNALNLRKRAPEYVALLNNTKEALSKAATPEEKSQITAEFTKSVGEQTERTLLELLDLEFKKRLALQITLPRTSANINNGSNFTATSGPAKNLEEVHPSNAGMFGPPVKEDLIVYDMNTGVSLETMKDIDAHPRYTTPELRASALKETILESTILSTFGDFKNATIEGTPIKIQHLRDGEALRYSYLLADNASENQIVQMELPYTKNIDGAGFKPAYEFFNEFMPLQKKRAANERQAYDHLQTVYASLGYKYLPKEAVDGQLPAKLMDFAIATSNNGLKIEIARLEQSRATKAVELQKNFDADVAALLKKYPDIELDKNGMPLTKLFLKARMLVLLDDYTMGNAWGQMSSGSRGLYKSKGIIEGVETVLTNIQNNPIESTASYVAAIEGASDKEGWLDTYYTIEVVVEATNRRAAANLNKSELPVYDKTDNGVQVIQSNRLGGKFINLAKFLN
jgi:hypothetical protein